MYLYFLSNSSVTFRTVFMFHEELTRELTLCLLSLYGPCYTRICKDWHQCSLMIYSVIYSDGPEEYKISQYADNMLTIC